MGKEGMLLKINITNNTSIEEEDLKKEISIFPNPTKGVLQIEISQDLIITHIALFDLLGRLVKDFNREDRSLDISDLKKGNYVLNIETNKGTFSEKMVNE